MSTSIELARLPASYEAASRALAECSQIDECQQWADKAEALASYARQAKDDQLRKMADRIQARAVRRCGELLKQIPSGQGSRNQHGELHDGTVTRQDAADQAGISERQKVTALRVASVPADKFELQVESDSPPTITQLADQGRMPRVIVVNADADALARKGAIAARDALRAFTSFCIESDAASTARAFQPNEVAEMRARVSDADRWLDVFVTNLSE